MRSADMAIRRPRAVTLPRSAYAAPDGPLVPDHLAQLPTAPGRCHSPETVVLNCRGAVDIVCTDCAMIELGENWANFKARTNAGTPKKKFYDALDRLQSQPDPDFARQQRWAREYLNRNRV